MRTLLVTGLYDINRNDWSNYSRSFDTYLNNFSNVLDTNCDIVVFYEDERVYNIAISKNKSNVKLIYKKLCEFETYIENYTTVSNILNDPNFRNSLRRYDNPPEHFSAVYNILMLCKSEMMKVALNTFNYDYYFWIDAGYSQNGEMFIDNIFPDVEKLIQLDNKFTFFLDENMNDINSITLFNDINFCKNISYTSGIIYITGCFFGGVRDSCIRFIEDFGTSYKNYHQNNMTDDDQIFLNMIYAKNVDSYNLIKLSRVKKTNQSFFSGYFMLCK